MVHKPLRRACRISIQSCRTTPPAAHLGGQVLQDGGGVHGGGGTHTTVGGGAALEQTVDTAHGELQAGTRRARDGLLLVAARALDTDGTLGTLRRREWGRWGEGWGRRRLKGLQLLRCWLGRPAVCCASRRAFDGPAAIGGTGDAAAACPASSPLLQPPSWLLPSWRLGYGAPSQPSCCVGFEPAAAAPPAAAPQTRGAPCPTGPWHLQARGRGPIRAGGAQAAVPSGPLLGRPPGGPATHPCPTCWLALVACTQERDGRALGGAGGGGRRARGALGRPGPTPGAASWASGSRQAPGARRGRREQALGRTTVGKLSPLAPAAGAPLGPGCRPKQARRLTWRVCAPSGEQRNGVEGRGEATRGCPQQRAAAHGWCPAGPLLLFQGLPGATRRGGKGPRGPPREPAPDLPPAALQAPAAAPRTSQHPRSAHTDARNARRARQGAAAARRRRPSRLCFSQAAAVPVGRQPARQPAPVRRLGRLAPSACGNAGRSGQGVHRRAAESNGIATGRERCTGRRLNAPLLAHTAALPPG